MIEIYIYNIENTIKSNILYQKINMLFLSTKLYYIIYIQYLNIQYIKYIYTSYIYTKCIYIYTQTICLKYIHIYIKIYTYILKYIHIHRYIQYLYTMYLYIHVQ